MANEIDPKLLETIRQAADWLLINELIDHPEDSETTKACRLVLKERRETKAPENHRRPS
jgi:hypothetical protein